MIHRAGWLLVICLCLGGATFLPAQVEFHGNVYPLVRVSFEQRYLSLPHRLITLEGTRRGDGVSLFFSAALEYRLGENTATLDLREAYAEVATGLGDLRLGKQIIAWGAADGNNPTDNISPYDFYYLFLAGTERKLGNLAAAANLYLGNVNLEAALTPVFQPNRLPLGEPDFPVFGDAPPLGGAQVENRPLREVVNSEFGFRLRLPLNAMDLSLSFFNGFDRIFTAAIDLSGTEPNVNLDYHRTRVFGGDLVYFLGDWGLRGEAAYFLTEDDGGTDPTIRNPYFQYVFQLDRSAENSSLLVQYLGSYITLIDGGDVVAGPLTGTFSEEVNGRDKVPSKLGMPFAAIAENALLAAASYDFADGRYSLQANALYEFDHQGYMLGGRLVAALEEAFDLEVGLTYLGGSDESRLSAIGEVFSHAYLGLRYSF